MILFQEFFLAHYLSRKDKINKLKNSFSLKDVLRGCRSGQTGLAQESLIEEPVGLVPAGVRILLPSSIENFYIDGIGQYLEKNPSLLEYFDAIEVHNGEAVWLPLFTPRNANQKARGFYEEIKSDFDIGALSSSDGHSFGEIGSSYSYLPQIEFRDSETLTSSLRKAIREHKNLDNDRRHNSTFPALNHAAYMAFLIFTGKVKI